MYTMTLISSSIYIFIHRLGKYATDVLAPTPKKNPRSAGIAGT